jgi:hypothetical protein
MRIYFIILKKETFFITLFGYKKALNFLVIFSDSVLKTGLYIENEQGVQKKKTKKQKFQIP